MTIVAAIMNMSMITSINTNTNMSTVAVVGMTTTSMITAAAVVAAMITTMREKSMRA